MCAYRIMRIYGLNNFLTSLTVTFLSVFQGGEEQGRVVHDEHDPEEVSF